MAWKIAPPGKVMLLTDRQREVLLFIQWSIDERGAPPTMREIMTRFDLGSTNAAAWHLNALKRKGWIEGDRYRNRGMRVLFRAVPIYVER